MKYMLILVLGLIIYISFNSTFINPYLFEGADKIKHFIAFFILSFLFYKSFEGTNNIYIILILAFFAVLIEVVQSFIGREASFIDFLAGLTGVVFYFILSYFIKNIHINS